MGLRRGWQPKTAAQAVWSHYRPKTVWRVWKDYSMTAIKELLLQLACRLYWGRFIEGYCKNLERQKSNTCKSSLTKNLMFFFRSKHPALRPSVGNSFVRHRLYSAQQGAWVNLKNSTDVISFAWVGCLPPFILQSLRSIAAWAVFKTWKMCQLSKWLRERHQRNRLLEQGMFRRNRSQEILNHIALENAKTGTCRLSCQGSGTTAGSQVFCKKSHIDIIDFPLSRHS